jgi:hypothetical protein
MKLCMINLIHEGFGFDTSSHDPDKIVAAELDPLFVGNTIYFKSEDSPQDVVKIIPALESSSLEEYIDYRRLANFEGRVYYGFKTVSGDDYRNAAIDAWLKPLEQALDQERSHQKEQLITVGDCVRLSKIYRDPQRWGQEGEPNPAKAEILDKAVVIAMRVRAAYGYKGKQADFGIQRAINTIIARTGAQYAKTAGYAFAQRLKNPGPPDREIVAKFLELSRDQLAKLPGTAIAYDYVVAPQSSSSFNQELARLVSKDRGSELLIVQKRLGRDVTVDRDQIMQRAKDVEAPIHYRDKDEKWELKLKKKDSLEFDTADEFADAWGQNEYEKLQNVVGKMPKTKEAKIKDNTYHDKRRYAKIFSPTDATHYDLLRHDDPEPVSTPLAAAAGKSVLVIDDNLVGGATVELIYEVLQGLPEPPKRVDIFIPLRITGW